MQTFEKLLIYFYRTSIKQFIDLNSKKMKSIFYLCIITACSLTACSQTNSNTKKSTDMSNNVNNSVYSKTDTAKVLLPEEEWKKILPEDVFQIAREKGTERPFTGKYDKHKEVGIYYCMACGNPLFSSNGKFESSCGWPSFFEPVKKGNIIYAPDNAYGMNRTEVMCGRCKAHLGHVFEDGPPPTGLRYCINSVILDFEKASDADKKYKTNQ